MGIARGGRTIYSASYCHQKVSKYHSPRQGSAITIKIPIYFFFMSLKKNIEISSKRKIKGETWRMHILSSGQSRPRCFLRCFWIEGMGLSNSRCLALCIQEKHKWVCGHRGHPIGCLAEYDGRWGEGLKKVEGEISGGGGRKGICQMHLPNRKILVSYSKERKIILWVHWKQKRS